MPTRNKNSNKIDWTLPTEPKKLTLPTVHLNGTDRDDLFRQNEAARYILSQGIRALGEACPNGRDFYPQGPNAINTATAEHGARLDAIRTVIKELEQIAEHIQDS